MTPRRLTDMGDKVIANMYRANKIYSSPASTAKHGTIVSVPHSGRRLTVQAKPVASVADYEAWHRGRNSHKTGNSRCTGAKLRRIVIMRRQGSSWRECGEAVGVTGSCAQDWVEFLPFDLSV